jgi:hypothetical protein
MGGKIEEWYQNKLSKVHSDMEGMHSWMEGEKRRTGMVREETEQLDEISMQKLTQYKTAAAKSASEADKAGDIKKGDKRFSGIMRATKKQFAKTTNEGVEQIDEERYGFFGTKNPKIGDKVRHKSGASGTIKSISTQGKDTHVHFKLDKDTKILGIPHKKGEVATFHAKHVTPVNEDVEQIDELSKSTLGSYAKRAAYDATTRGIKYGEKMNQSGSNTKELNKINKRETGVQKAVDRLAKESVNEGKMHISPSGVKTNMDPSDDDYQMNYGKNGLVAKFRKKQGLDVETGDKKIRKEETEHLEEKNVPTSPEKWAQAKAQAKAKFDVYPSAYANGWAAKKYKEMGGGWKKANESVEIDEDLRKWFDPKHPEGGWKRVNTKGEVVGDCAREEGESKPKCMSNEKRASLTKKERASAVRTKRKHDSNPERKGSPINVSNYGKGKISEQKNDVPFSGPYTKQSSTVTDKSGAKHGPSSTVKHLARMAQKKQVEKLKKPVNESLQESRRVEIVREAMKDAKLRDEKKRKDGEVKGNKDAFEPNPTLTSQIVKTSS